ncbi:MAG TPA: hypothetical protein DIW38_05160 [Oceanicaulis sp.]|nr:hypothetical protein [Oceanicaulis sp.]
MTGESIKPQEIRTLTVLRGVAASWVVLFHFAGHFDLNLKSVTIIANGFLAVDLFFYLSGFIIFLVYFQGFEGGRFRFFDFIKKRFARLYPVHFVTTVLIAGLFLVSAAAGIRPLPDTFNAYHFLINILMVHAWGLSGSLSFNYPSWSISAEMFAYALFPIMALFVLRFRLWIVGLTAFVLLSLLAIIAREWLGRPLVHLTYDFSILRILPEFLIGGWTYMVVRSLSRPSPTVVRIACAGSVLVTLVMFSVWEASVYMTLIFPVLIASLYLLETGREEQATPKGPAFLMLPYESLVYLGKISYSLYMIHAFFEMTCFSVIERVFDHPADAVPLFWLFPVMLLTFAGAAIVYELVEKPGRKYTLGVLVGRKS